ncbi:hypothetical protein [Leptospira sp. 'Mane']|uniref:hypothetical protein n=1 Tax=Leptospira sp. 'Mane' TaxID=3387407 RepID=UPI00398B6430
MNKNLITLSLMLFSITHCISFQNYELNISKNLKYDKPQNISIKINNINPNLNNEFERIFLSTFSNILKNENIMLNFQGEKTTNDLSVKIYWIVDNSHKVTTNTTYIDARRRIETRLNVPQIRAEMKIFQNGDDDPILSINKTFLCDYKSTGENVYNVEKPEILTVKIAHFYANILTNSFKEPSSLTGTWINLQRREVVYNFPENDKESVGIYESPIYENYLKKKIKHTSIYKINANHKAQGLLHIHDGEEFSKTLYVEDGKETQWTTAKRFYIFGDMIFTYKTEFEEKNKIFYADYFLKEK